MRIVLLSLLALSACHSVGGIAPLDTADPDTEADTDTDTDTDTDSDADTDTDTDTDSDADTDTSPSYEGYYEGDVSAVVTYLDWWSEEGGGEFDLDIDASGVAEGWGWAFSYDHWSWEGEGDITGQVEDGAFEGTWMVTIYEGETLAHDLSGTVDEDGSVQLEVYYAGDWWTTTGTLDGQRE